MSTNTRKKVFLTIAGLTLCIGAVLIIDTLKGFSRTVPVTVGPYREAVFAGLLLLLVFSLAFAFRPIGPQTICGTLCIVISVFWFMIRKILFHNASGTGPAGTMGRWLPAAMALFGAGAALWTGTFFPKKRKDPVLSEKWQIFLVLLLMFIILQPALKGGFCWDDAFFSVEAQAMRLTGKSIFARVWKEIVDYVRIGRINPFATFHFLVFYYIPDVRIYKLLLAVLTLLGGWLFYRFLHLWTGDHHLSILSLAAVSFCFQFRLYHDPLNSYYGLMQVMFCELMAALICFLLWLRTGKTRNMVFSLLFFAMGLMSYEMFFPFTALFLIPALEQEKHPGKAIRKVIPWLLLALLLFCLSMVLRGNITEETAYSGTTFGLDIPLILRTFTNQVGAALPLSYRLSGYDTGLFGKTILWEEIFNTSLYTFLNSIQWQDVIAALIPVMILYALPSKRMSFSWYRVCFGVLLWLLPGTVISLSTKYQIDLVPGLAYIPVYFSYFGMGLLLYELLTLAGRLFSFRTARLLTAGIGCIILLLGMQDDRHINAMLDDIFLYPRKTGEAALQAGILGETPSETVVSAVPYSLWEHGWLWEPYQSKFYSLNTRTPVNALGVRDYADRFRDEQPLWIQPSDTALITYSGDAEGGFAKSGILKGTGFLYEENKLNAPIVSTVFFFVSGKNQSGVTLIYETRDAEWKQIPVEKTWLIRQTPEGTLYKLEENIPVLFDTIGIRTY